MRQHVYLAVALALKLLAAHLALILVIGHVAPPLVGDQALPDRGQVTAVVAAETLLLGKVFLLVFIQLQRRREAAAAILADQLLVLLRLRLGLFRMGLVRL